MSVRHLRLEMNFRTSFLTLACTVGLAGVAHAQKGEDDVPRAYRPPPGMCRIWLDRVPAKQQPAPTDCPTAVRNRPSNGRVLFGDDYVEGPAKGDKKEIPLIKRFGGDRKP
jgi:hypothetical protein